MEKKLLTPQQVADYMQVDFRTVYLLLRSGELPGIKVGRVWRIRPEDLEDFLQKNIKQGKGDRPGDM
jgi:excisionase family DNA binding protein